MANETYTINGKKYTEKELLYINPLSLVWDTPEKQKEFEKYIMRVFGGENYKESWMRFAIACSK